jgi:hypothetical protein
MLRSCRIGPLVSRSATVVRPKKSSTMAATRPAAVPTGLMSPGRPSHQAAPFEAPRTVSRCGRGQAIGRIRELESSFGAASRSQYPGSGQRMQCLREIVAWAAERSRDVVHSHRTVGSMLCDEQYRAMNSSR